MNILIETDGMRDQLIQSSLLSESEENFVFLSFVFGGAWVGLGLGEGERKRDGFMSDLGIWILNYTFI